MPRYGWPDVVGIGGRILRNAQTIPKAIEMVQRYKEVSANERDKGMDITGTKEDREIIKAVVAVENEISEANGRHDDVLVLNEKNATVDPNLVQQVMQHYMGDHLTAGGDNDPDHPLTVDPKSAFDSPRRR